MVHWLCCIHLCCCKYSTRGRCCMCPFSWDKTSHHPQFQVLPCKHSFWSISTLRELQREQKILQEIYKIRKLLLFTLLTNFPAHCCFDSRQMLQLWRLSTIGDWECTIVKRITAFWILIWSAFPALYRKAWKDGKMQHIVYQLPVIHFHPNRPCSTQYFLALSGWSLTLLHAHGK